MPITNKHTDSQPEILSPLSDYIFSILFGDQRHVDILAAFLKTILDLPVEDYASLTVVNPFLKRLFKTDKAGIVDTRLTTGSGKVIHIELQVAKVRYMRERLAFYLAKLLEEQIKRGEDWQKLQQVVSIVICDHELLAEEREYINEYELRNKRSNKSFTELMKLIILEIPKLSTEGEGSAVWPWLKLFTCKKPEQYEELGRRYPEVNMAVRVLKELSLIGRIRMLAEAREIQRRDNRAALDYELMEAQERGEEQKALEIARRMKNRGISPDQIAEDTGLSPEDVAGL